MFLACYLNDGRPINPNTLPRELTYADHRGHDYHSVSSCDIEKLTPPEILLLRGAVLIKLLSETPVRPMLVKTHNANALISDVKLIPPCLTRNAVYIVRDPRDVAVSYAEWTGDPVDEMIDMMGDTKSIIPNPEGSGATSVFHYLGGWSVHVRSWMKSDTDTLIVKYERLHEDPERVFTEIVKQIGWEMNPSRVRRAMNNSVFDKLRKQEDRNGFHECPASVDKFFRSGSVGGWREYLTEKQSDRIVSDHGEVMEKLGYI